LLEVKEDDELAIDWINGRRTPDANQLLTGALTGITLGTDTVKLFRSIAESTCFGAKAIVDRFETEGVEIKGLIGLGGIANKSPFIMQMMADVMNMNIRIHRSEQTCALGAAMFAATAAGIYEKVEDAMNAMGQGFSATYVPNTLRVPVYAKRFSKYKSTGKMVEQQTVHYPVRHSSKQPEAAL
jgi:L-ribulokinase